MARRAVQDRLPAVVLPNTDHLLYRLAQEIADFDKCIALGGHLFEIEFD